MDMRGKGGVSSLSDERLFLGVLAIFTFNLAFSEAVKEIFLVIAFLLVLLRIAKTPGPVGGRILILGLPVLVFTGISLLSALNSINRFQGLRGFWGDFESLMAWVVFSGALMLSADRMRTVRVIAKALVLGIIAGGCVGIFRMIFQGIPVLGMMNLGDKNSTAQFLSSVFLILLALWTIRKQLGLAPSFLIPSLGCVACLLILTHSRSFLISVPAASCAILLITRQWKTLGVVAGTMAFCATLISLNSNLRWEMESVIHPLNDGSFVSRYLTWEGAIRMYHAHPFLGVGPDNFQMKNIHRIYGLPDYASHGHNIFFNILGEYGALGVFSFGTILLFWALRIIPGKDATPSAHFLKALTVGFLLNMVMAGVAHPMWGGSFSLVVMLVMAMVLVTDEAPIPPERRLRRFLPAGLPLKYHRFP